MITHLLAPSLNGCCGQGWTRPDPGAWGCVQVSHVGNGGPSTCAILLLNSGTVAGSWDGCGAADTQTDTLIRC